MPPRSTARVLGKVSSADQSRREPSAIAPIAVENKKRRREIRGSGFIPPRYGTRADVRGLLRDFQRVDALAEHKGLADRTHHRSGARKVEILAKAIYRLDAGAVRPDEMFDAKLM